MKRLGWTVLKECPAVWITPRGRVDIRVQSPAEIEVLARDAAEISDWAEYVNRGSSDPALRQIQGAPFWEPLRALVNGPTSGDWQPKHQGALRCAVAGGIVTQQRLFNDASPGVTSPNCAACQAAVGTEHHGYYRCDASAGFRRSYGHPELFRQAELRPELLLWTRGLASDPTLAHPPPAPHEAVVWRRRPEGERFCGTGYGDGSGRGPKQARRLFRCGWGLTVLHGDRGFVAQLHGPLPGPIQDVPAAEAMALLQYLLHYDDIEGTAIFVTDCRVVKDTFDKGPGRSDSSAGKHAHIWRRIWARVDDLGGMERVEVRWVPSHTSMARVRDGTITETDRAGNQLADQLACLGVNGHIVERAVVRRAERLAEVINMVGRYIGRLVLASGTAFPAWASRPQAREGAARRQRVERSLPRVSRRGHIPVSIEGRTRCRRCMASAGSLAILDLRPCQELKRSVPHTLVTTGTVVWCGRCGAYSERSVRALRGTCGGGKAVAGGRQLRRLRAGQHPRTGVPIRTCMAGRRLTSKQAPCGCSACAIARAVEAMPDTIHEEPEDEDEDQDREQGREVPEQPWYPGDGCPPPPAPWTEDQPRGQDEDNALSNFLEPRGE